MPRDERGVLGIDAAWTPQQASGVALWKREQGRWRSVRAASSYDSFCGTRNADVAAVLDVSRERLDGAALSVVAVDMPLDRKRITGRRAADDSVSRRFGHCKCSVYSPTPERPGTVSDDFRRVLERKGYPLVTDKVRAAPALIEVYPHVALLALMARGERLEYKANKTRTYWPDGDVPTRKRALVGVWREILARLEQEAGGIGTPWPLDAEEYAFSALKGPEDILDGHICAWVAAQYLNGAAVPIGDHDAAIWVPRTALKFAKPDHG